MNNNFLNVYNNLIKLTRNKYIFDFAFFLKVYKNQTSKKDLQNLYDFVFKQIELSIREIGYGDSSVNKKMKLYVNLMYSIIDKVELWKKLNLSEKTKFFSDFIEVKKESPFFINYFNLSKYEFSNNNILF